MKNKIFFIVPLILACVLMAANESFSQCNYNVDLGKFVGPDGGPCRNTVSTAVPFLRITPDARSGAMGDAGLAISPDANAMHMNASRLAFAEDKFQVSATYTPWLQSLGLRDVYLAYLSGFVNLDEFQTIGFSLRYFSLGQIDFVSEDQVDIGSGKPNEFEIAAAYARKLGDNFSASLSAKFIYSNLANGQTVDGIVISPGTALAADIGFLYKIPFKRNGIATGNDLSIGLAATNIGTKISYTESVDRDFIPANLGLGVAANIQADDYNKFTFTADVNKLMVPTPCLSDDDSPVECDEDGDDRADFLQQSATSGILSSFSDAPPGSSELNELMYSFGVEYTYNEQFSVRGGYFTEHRTNGNRRYATIGAGLKYNVFAFNVSYLIPTSSQRSPLDNTLRFSFIYSGGQPGE